MKKLYTVSIIFILIFSVNESSNAQKTSDSFDYFNGSFYKDNYVWGGAMNLCWHELSENIFKAEIKLNTHSPDALKMLKKLNVSTFTKDDLDELSYYIKSGYGQKTVDLINKESKLKFPEKSFDDLNFELAPFDIISYAYFFKKIEYETQFEEKQVYFEKEKVNGFHAANFEQKKNIRIHEYKNENKFIISIQLKNDSEQLIFAKGYNISNPNKILLRIKEIEYDDYEPIREQDIFEMPDIDLNYHRDYTEMIGKSFANKGFESYIIKEMFENVTFNLDHTGAKVENEAVVVPYFTGVSLKEKKLVLDKPFWVIMKQTNSEHPYFMLGVKNTAIMEKE